jgi:hypothetical protein
MMILSRAGLASLAVAAAVLALTACGPGPTPAVDPANAPAQVLPSTDVVSDTPVEAEPEAATSGEDQTSNDEAMAESDEALMEDMSEAEAQRRYGEMIGISNCPLSAEDVANAVGTDELSEGTQLPGVCSYFTEHGYHATTLEAQFTWVGPETQRYFWEERLLIGAKQVTSGVPSDLKVWTFKHPGGPATYIFDPERSLGVLVLGQSDNIDHPERKFGKYIANELSSLTIEGQSPFQA